MMEIKKTKAPFFCDDTDLIFRLEFKLSYLYTRKL